MTYTGLIIPREKIKKLLENCTEGRLYKLNVVLAYKEYLDDYASEETEELGEEIIRKMKEICL